MVVGNNKPTTATNVGNCWWFQLPCGCSGVMQGTLPEPYGAHPGQHWKLLDAATSQVPAPYCPGGCHGRRIRMKHTKH